MGDWERTLIIGDVHGCLQELDDLLAAFEPRPGRDRIIFIGDLINKGPDSLGVWRRYRELEAEAILGNHELRLLEMVDGDAPRGAIYQRIQQEFGDAFPTLIEDVRSWPLFIESDWFLVVHAGLVPGRTPHQCSAHILTNIRTWDGKGQDLNNREHPPWFDGYTGRRLVVFGHWASLNGLVRPSVIGLDTGCVYGKALTGLVLPDRKLITIPARKPYCAVSG